MEKVYVVRTKYYSETNYSEDFSSFDEAAKYAGEQARNQQNQVSILETTAHVVPKFACVVERV